VKSALEFCYRGFAAPANTASQQIVDDRLLPAGPVNLWPPVKHRLHVIMAPAMAHGQIEHGALAHAPDIEDGMAALGDVAVDKAADVIGAIIFGVEQDIEFGAGLDQILLVGGFKAGDALD